MSRHKNPPINTRNWDAMSDWNDEELQDFEKVRRHAVAPEERRARPKPTHPRHNFHRPRS